MTHQNLAGRLHKLTRLLTSLSEHRWASDGYEDIKMGHLQVLTKLAERDFTNSQLASLSTLTKQSMSRLTKELLQTGYIVHSETRSADGRERFLTLSPRGETFIAYLDTVRNDFEVKLAALLTPEGFAAFSQSIDTLLDFVVQRHGNLL